jgi:hypothetical protein
MLNLGRIMAWMCAGAIGSVAVFAFVASGQIAGIQGPPAAPAGPAYRLGPTAVLGSAGTVFTALSSSPGGTLAKTPLEQNTLVRTVLDSKGKRIIASDGTIIVSVDGAIGAIPLDAYKKSKVLPPVSAAVESESAKIADWQANALWRAAHMIDLKKVERDKLYIENRPAVKMEVGQRYAVYRITWDLKKSSGFFVQYRALRVGDAVVAESHPEFITATYKGLAITNADVRPWGYAYQVFVP